MLRGFTSSRKELQTALQGRRPGKNAMRTKPNRHGSISWVGTKLYDAVRQGRAPGRARDTMAAGNRVARR